MRVVFMGTPSFAVESLRALHDAHEVVAVYSRPDSPAGRGRRLQPPPVKTAAVSLGIPVFQPERLGPADVDELASMAPEVICVAAYGLLLPSQVLGVPTHGAINVHASLLPRHRGAAPIERAILDGDTVTGVSIMQMEESLDTGPVARAVESPVADHTAETLAHELARIGAAALLDVLKTVADGTVVWVSQDESAATYATKVSAVDVALDPSLDRDCALRRIRASSRRAPARLELCGSPATITLAEAVDTPLAPGSVVLAKTGLLLGLADGAIGVLGLRPENRGEMTGAAFVSGTRGHADPTWRGLP